VVTRVSVPGHRGDPVEAVVLRPRERHRAAPCVVFLHGGGMVMGDPHDGPRALLPLVAEHGAVVVSIGYRLAPEHPDPTPVEDCYAALVHLGDHADELGVDPTRILLAGVSAGGGLAAGAALLVRDRGGPALVGLALTYPMLDDRDATVSAQQLDGRGIWDRTSNALGWTALLGERRGAEDVSIYSAPGRADDLGGLPPTFVAVGSADVFRDEDVAFASRIWAGGGLAELHVWPGAFHGFDDWMPAAALSDSHVRTRADWIARRLLAPTRPAAVEGDRA
jgi:acetyl esterase/lipase